MRNIRLVFICLLLMLVTAGVILAATDYGIGRSVVSPGGGERASENYMLRDVIGEPAVGIAQSDNYLLRAGFLTYIGPGVSGTCGDVNDDGNMNMADMMTLWYDIADYPEPGIWNISNEWAADVNCDGNINMADVMILWYDIADYPEPGAWVVGCCE
jgi:hypothetical protein